MSRFGTPRHYFASLPSTMDRLTELALQGAPEGTIVVAGEQTAGRGRGGRSWVTPPNAALLMSVLLRPKLSPEQLAPFPLIAGLAVAEGIEALVGSSLPDGIDLKWPNDLYCSGRKLCGVLMQARSSQRAVEFVNLGIGLNVNTPRESLPETATSLAVLTGKTWRLEQVERAVLDHLSNCYDQFLSDGPETGLTAWFERALYRDELVRIENAGTAVSGRFVGVTRTGALRLQTDSGIEEIVAGDLTRGPKPL